jgi:hypothetical protein
MMLGEIRENHRELNIECSMVWDLDGIVMCSTLQAHVPGRPSNYIIRSKPQGLVTRGSF